MARKRKYSTEQRLEIVLKYESGNVSFGSLADEYGIDRSTIRAWRDAYREHGIFGLAKKNRKYSGDFKVNVIEYMHNTSASIRQTAAHFNISTHTTILRWVQIFNEEGKDALYEEHRGRASKMETKKPKKPKTNVNENEDLLAELEYLRMENEYLKKLNALVQKREKSESPKK